MRTLYEFVGRFQGFPLKILNLCLGRPSKAPLSKADMLTKPEPWMTLEVIAICGDHTWDHIP